MPTNPLAQAALEMAHECRISLENVHVEKLFARALLQWKLEAHREYERNAPLFNGDCLLYAQGRIAEITAALKELE